MFDDQVVQFADCKVIVDVPCRDVVVSFGVRYSEVRIC